MAKKVIVENNVIIEDYSEEKVKGKRAVIYARYSSAKQNEMSLDQQIGECGSYITTQGYGIPLEIYQDDAKSASKDVHKRRDFIRMLEDAKKGNFDVVVAYALDRIAREEDDSFYDYEKELKKSGVRLEYASQKFDEDSDDGGIIKAIYVKMAQIYVKKLRRDSMRGMRANAKEGNYAGGGAIPLGYTVSEGDSKGKRKKYLIDPIAAPFVKQAFEMYLSGKTTQEVGDYLSDNGFFTANGKRYDSNSINRMLGNPLYKGAKVTHFNNKEEHKTYTVLDACEAIIDEETWNRVQVEKGRRSYTGQSEYHREDYVLTGKLFCGTCGAKMVADKGTGRGNDKNKTPGKTHYYYKCNNRKNKRVKDPEHCNKAAVDKQKLEDTVFQILTDEFWGKDSIRTYEEASKKAEMMRPVNPQIAKLKAERKKHETALNRAVKGYMDTEVPQFLIESKEEERRIKEIDTTLEALNRLENTKMSASNFSKKIKEVRKIWDELCSTSAGRIEIVNRFVDKIIVYDPEDPTDPNKFKITFIIKVDTDSDIGKELEMELDLGAFENDEAGVTKASNIRTIPILGRSGYFRL